MADIYYDFGFSLPIRVQGENSTTLFLGEIEDCEATACINLDECGGWYLDEFKVKGSYGADEGKSLEGVICINPHMPEQETIWLLEAVQAAFNKAHHSIDIEQIIRTEYEDNDALSYLEQERAIYHQSVL